MKSLNLLAKTIALSAILCSSQAIAQQDIANNTGPQKSFELSAEKRAIRDETDGQTHSLRIQRKQLDANLTNEQGPDASFRAMTGARGDQPNAFGMRAEDWSAAPRAAASPLVGRVTSAKDLANFDLELIVDQSLSMRRRDCPGRTSRWDWCGMQLSNLSDQLAPYAPRGFTLTTFASEFQSYQNATARDVQQLFSGFRLGSGTRLAGPLDARLGHYFQTRNAHSKPLLIVVITDGVPSPATEPMLVAGTLIAATRRMVRPDEVTVVFFQIGGGDQLGRFFLSQMDNTLVAAGAKYDIVRSVPFEQLERFGLTQSLVAAVRNFAQPANR